MVVNEHFFRHEAGRLVATLTRLFGVKNLALAEDVAQDALVRALEVWKLQGIPDDPSAWLTVAAKRRALDALRRERNAQRFSPDLTRHIQGDWKLAPALESHFGALESEFDQLRLMYACCDPRMAATTQTALFLQLLCGFGVAEIAVAFLTGEAAMQKRLVRAKALLARRKQLFSLDDASALAPRLGALQRALYLLFNEGYHSASDGPAVRAELCQEAMRLTALLLRHGPSATPATRALAALMCLHAARLPARLGPEGGLASLEAQDRSRWDQALLAQGLQLLEESAAGDELTVYHLEAAIASVHARAPSFTETCWDAIVPLYDALFRLQPGPIVALNRAVAIAQRDGAERGLQEVHAIVGAERLERYPFFAATLGELELRLGRRAQAELHFREAAGLARNASERAFLERRAKEAR